MTSQLFTELRFKSGLTLKNRLVKAAMNEAMGDKHFQLKKELIGLYEKWAEGGTGLLITGNVMVDPRAIAEPGNIVFNENSDRSLLKQWAQAGKKNGTKILVQINHPGKQAPKTVTKQPVAPSSVPVGGDMATFFNPPKALTLPEIENLVHKFGRAAQLAEETGFDGVEIHGAHGYLINQFLSPFDNRRSDLYGGSLDNRMRFLVEVYQEMRRLTSPQFTIGLKINSSDFKEGGFTEAESMTVVEKMDQLGIDFIEISGGNYEHPKTNDTTSKDKNTVFFADYGKQIKQKIQAPVIVTGGIRSVEAMNDLLATAGADLVGLARPLAMQPDLANRMAQGTYQTLETKRLSTGIKALDRKVGPLLGLVYYQLLMQSYAKGRTPHLTQNAWPSLIHALTHQGLAVLTPQRVKKGE